jgi:hypothetical protein
MKALWFLPFAYAAGAEGFALFAPYLIGVLTVLHFARVFRRARFALSPAVTTAFRLPARRVPAAAQPAIG